LDGCAKRQATDAAKSIYSDFSHGIDWVLKSFDNERGKNKVRVGKTNVFLRFLRVIKFRLRH
jgi:hypothetical protein